MQSLQALRRGGGTPAAIPSLCSRRWRFGGFGQKPVAADVIRGEAFLSMELSWPIILWNAGRCWAYLHDMDPRSLQSLMTRLRDAEFDRNHPHGILHFGAPQ